MCKLYCFILSLLISLSLFSQQANSLEGKVFDKDSMPVSNVSLRILNSNTGATSNLQGFFSIPSLMNGRYQLEISAIGFTQQVKTVDITEGIKNPIIIYLEPSNNYLDEIVVSAEKKEEKLQKIPFSVTALNARQVKDFRLWNLQEITAIVPNLYSSNPGDNRNVTSIRGIGTTSYDPAIATYVDGVNQFNLDTYIPQLADVERIEVLRGPQGTLYGRNAMGGVINVITRKPGSLPEIFAELNAGTDGIQRYVAGFKTPVITGKLFAGAALYYGSRKGFYQNQYTGDDFDRQGSFIGNYYVKYYPAANWSLVANVKHAHNRNNGAFPLAPDKATAFAEPYTVNQNALAKMQDDNFNASLSVTNSGKKISFNSITAYQSNSRVYDKPLDGDFSPLDIISIFNNYGKSFNNVKVLSQEFKFSSPANEKKPLQWTAGTFLFHQDNPVKQATIFGAQAPLFGIPDSNFSIINTNEGINAGIAFYGQATYQLSSKLSITAGIRYDYEKKKLSVLGEYLKEPDQPFTITPDTSATEGFNAISPKLGLTYSVTENNLVYITYSRGFRTGGFTQLSSDPGQPPLYPYNPEFSDNIEAGWKNTWFQHRLRLNLSAFYSKIRQAQVPTLVLPDAITVISNAGTVESKGLEAEISARPLKGLEVIYNAGLTDAAFTRLRLSQNGQEINLDGNRQIFTPASTSMLAIQYSVPLSVKNQVTLVARGEWINVGSQFFDLANTIEQKNYSLLNARAGLMFKQFEMFLWGRNMGQVKYIAYAYDFGGVHLGNPGTYGITFSLRLQSLSKQ